MIIRRIAPQNEGKKLKVAAYCRVSTDKQSQEDSLEYQERTYRNMILANPRWELAGIYTDEGRSGVNDRRPGFLRMIEDAKAGNIDKVLVKSISRFSRNILDCRKNIEELAEHDVSVYFEQEGIDSLNPGMLMLLSLAAAIAQDESRTNSDNHHWSNRRRTELGIYKIGNNQVLGYDADENGKPVPNKDAWIVKRMFELYAEGKEIWEIIEALSAAGATTVRGCMKFRDSQIRYILKNEIYVGDKLLQKQNPKDLMTKRPDSNREKYSRLLQNDHEAIISRTLWDKVQTRLAETGGKAKTRKNGHWLAGKIYCGECGQIYIRRTFNGGKGQKCKAWECRGRIKGNCMAPIIKEEKLLSAIGPGTDVEQIVIGEEIEVRKAG